MTRQVFDTLVEHDALTREIVPALATTWSHSRDGTQLTLTLRAGVRFHDGAPLDAAAAAASLSRALAHLAGARVEAAGPATVRITTPTPHAPLLAELARPSSAIVSPRSLTGAPAAAAGTGAFRLREGGMTADSVVLERNDDHWRSDRAGVRLPYADRVTFRAYPAPPARAAELRDGRADVATDLPPAVLATLRADPKVSLVPHVVPSVVYIGMHQGTSPFGRVEVRRAVAAAVDERAIASAVYASSGTAASQFLMPGTLGHDEGVTDLVPADAGAAKRALAAVALPQGFATELWYPPSLSGAGPEPRRLAELVAADLARAGIVVTLRSGDARAYAEAVSSGSAPMWIGEWTSDVLDPDACLTELFGPEGGAYDRPRRDLAWRDAPAWALMREARAELVPDKRAEVYKQIGKIVQRELPRIPLVHAESVAAVSRKIRGYVGHPAGTDVLAGVWVGR